jgi:ligand-binding sensor domain-containing protein
MGTDAGLYRIEHTAKPFGSSMVALPGTPVTLLGEDGAGRIWVHTNDGLRALEKGSLLPQKIPTLGLWLLDKEGKLWNCENNYLSCWQAADLLAGGAPMFKLAQPAALAGRSPDWNITTFEVDKSGVGWLGTNGYGLLKSAPGKRKFPHFSPAGVSGKWQKRRKAKFHFWIRRCGQTPRSPVACPIPGWRACPKMPS